MWLIRFNYEKPLLGSLKTVENSAKPLDNFKMKTRTLPHLGQLNYSWLGREGEIGSLGVFLTIQTSL